MLEKENPKRRGRPKSSKNKPKTETPIPKKPGRPRGLSARRQPMVREEPLPPPLTVGQEPPTLSPIFTDPAEAKSRLDKVTKRLLREKKYYSKSIHTAAKIVLEFIEGNNWVLLISPMQSGKTSIEAIAGILLAAIDQRFQDMIHICGNPQRDLTEQTEESLDATPMQHVRRHKLKNLSILKSFPALFCFDEVQFATGTRHTIGGFIRTNDLNISPLALFLAVSATPFAAFASGNFKIVWLKDDELSKIGYNSVSQMLKDGRVFNAQELFKAGASLKSIDVDEDSNFFKYTKTLFQRKRLYGYVIVRCSRPQQKILERKLKERFGSRVEFNEYNQNSRGIRMEQYFKEKRPGKITFVFIQQMARMGVRIPTQHIWAAYEYSKNATIETIAQSLVGRLCGYGKAEHKCRVYTKLDHVKAFAKFSNGDLEGFLKDAGSRSLRPSVRAKLELTSNSKLVDLAKLTLPGSMSKEECKQAIKQFAKEKLGITKLVIRILSHHKYGYTKSFRIWEIDTPARYFSVASEIGSVTAIVFDRYHEQLGWEVTWGPDTIVRFIIRIEAKNEILMVPVGCAFSERGMITAITLTGDDSSSEKERITDQ